MCSITFLCPHPPLLSWSEFSLDLLLAQLDILHRNISRIYFLNVLVSIQTSLNDISTFAINIVTDLLSSVSYWLLLLLRCRCNYVHTYNYLCTYYVPGTMLNFTFILTTTSRVRILYCHFMEEEAKAQRS